MVEDRKNMVMFGVRIDRKLKKKMKMVCLVKGIKMEMFMQRAVLNQIEKEVKP